MSVRICGDYKVLNAAIDDDKYPLPPTQDLFAKLSRKKNASAVFSIFDLSVAFNQIEVCDDSTPLLTINTNRGLYRMRILAYDVKKSPSILQATMDKILSGIENVTCFIDDTIVIGENEADHLKILNRGLARLEQHRVKLEKTEVSISEVASQICGPLSKC